MFSFSKTLTATAIGFAEQEGILSLDEKLVDLFPDERPAQISEDLARADIRSLLTMSCGHETESPLRESADWIRAFLAHEFKYTPGAMFQYNTLGTNMLAAILYRKTGCSLTQYLKPRLFDPLGMTDAFCSVMPDGVIQRDGSGFRLTLEDMMRFTQFFLPTKGQVGRRTAAGLGMDRPRLRRADRHRQSRVHQPRLQLAFGLRLPDVALYPRRSLPCGWRLRPIRHRDSRQGCGDRNQLGLHLPR